MAHRDTLKAELREAIAGAQDDGTYDDAGYARVQAAIAALTPLTPTPRPIDAQEIVASPWGSLYAQFGPRHTAGKPIRHATTANFLSFNLFPALPIMIDTIEQEIAVADAHYNNIHEITTPDGAHKGRLIIWGRYAIAPETPQRYAVQFYAVELVPLDGSSGQAFGLAEGESLRRELKPPKLHSDVVYCDDDLRINFGSMGGVYVLERLPGPAKTTESAQH